MFWGALLEKFHGEFCSNITATYIAYIVPSGFRGLSRAANKEVSCGVFWQRWRWCRAELWCRLLSSKSDTSVIVVYSATDAEFMFPLDWQNRSTSEGVRRRAP